MCVTEKKYRPQFGKRWALLKACMRSTLGEEPADDYLNTFSNPARPYESPEARRGR